jgi:hypothetical protein
MMVKYSQLIVMAWYAMSKLATSRRKVGKVIDCEKQDNVE